MLHQSLTPIVVTEAWARALVEPTGSVGAVAAQLFKNTVAPSAAQSIALVRFLVLIEMANNTDTVEDRITDLWPPT